MTQNFDAWELWLECQTQWRAGPMGVIGLDYPAVTAQAKRLAIELGVCTWKKIKCLERAVLENME